MYLDCDTTPAIKSRYTRYGVKFAMKLMMKANAEGQIGIYETCLGDGFKGYVIRYAGRDPYFEPAE